MPENNKRAGRWRRPSVQDIARLESSMGNRTRFGFYRLA